MTRFGIRSFTLLCGMLLASALSVVLRPTERIADVRPTLNLERIIPTQFADWNTDERNRVLAINPQQLAHNQHIYAQLLTRTYVSKEGYLIMLSIAYGSDQSDEMQVHRPEICYPSQGFTLWSAESTVIATTLGTIPIRHLVTSDGQRHEPITYWTTVGDRAVKDGIQKKLLEMKYRLRGKIPDGLLFRVSSIDPNDQVAFEQQAEFIDKLLLALDPSFLPRIAGIMSPVVIGNTAHIADN